MSVLEPLRLRLYVAGDAPNSTLAVANLQAFCQANPDHPYELEIVDVFKDARRALTEGILMTPTLIRLGPGPIRKIVGNLSQTAVLREALGLDAARA